MATKRKEINKEVIFMPRLDGTGPFGTGGRCTGTDVVWGRGVVGLGRGRGMGMGRGLCRNVGGITIRKEDELSSLKEQAIVIGEHLNTIKKRISELEEK